MTPKYAKTLSPGERVRSLRNERGWTMSELAWRAGISRSDVAGVEGGYLARSKIMQRILRALGVEDPAALPVRRPGAVLAMVEMTPERVALFVEAPVAFALAVAAIRKAAGRSPR